MSLNSGRIRNLVAENNQQESSFEADEENLVFSIQTLRDPLVKMNTNDRKKLLLLQKLHKVIDDDFLERRIEPRNIIFVP